MTLPSPPLLVISDRSQAKRPLVEIAAAAFRGGCRWFSLREKDLPADERSGVAAAGGAGTAPWRNGDGA